MARLNALPMTTGDVPTRGRAALRLVRDLTLPFGSLWVGDMRTRGTDEPRCVRWLVEMRLGVQEPISADDVLRQVAGAPSLPPDCTPRALGDVVPRGSRLIPVLLFRPCVHRLSRRDAVDELFLEFEARGRQFTRPLSAVWLFGAEATRREHLVPGPVDLDKLNPVESFDRAARLAERLRGPKARVTRRQLVRRGPMALLSAALHPAFRGQPEREDTAAAPASAFDLPSLIAGASARGPVDDLQIPFPDVDFADVFHRRRPGARGKHSYQEFIARLMLNDRARRPSVSRDEVPDAGKVESAVYHIEKRLETWRKRQLRAKAKAWLLPDLEHGHVLVGADEEERRLTKTLLITWAVEFAAASVSGGALREIGRTENRWARWEDNAWAIRLGDEPVVHRVAVVGVDEVGKVAVAKMRASGAASVQDGNEFEVCAMVIGGTPEMGLTKVEGLLPRGVTLAVESYPMISGSARSRRPEDDRAEG